MTRNNKLSINHITEIMRDRKMKVKQVYNKIYFN